VLLNSCDSLSLYIHIPFCSKKCNYCDFYSIPYRNNISNDFIFAQEKEWLILEKKYSLQNCLIKTIYFGGGTPSVLSLEQWEKINSNLIKRFNLSPNLEWSIECNPESFTFEKAMLWYEMGVNRLTFGIQSLNNNELKILGRQHTKEEAIKKINLSFLKKFKSIGIDIMYGLPKQTVESFEETLNIIFSLSFVSHISAYQLTLNKNTLLAKEKKLKYPTEDEILEMTNLIFDRCKKEGFIHYEISNFAKKGHECKHNITYWSHLPYIGLGPSAHSYIHPFRWANISNVEKYILKLNLNKMPIKFKEYLDKEKLTIELIYLGFRTKYGLDEQKYKMLTGNNFYSGKRIKIIDELIKDNLVFYKKGKYIPTEKGMLLADYIAKKLIFI